MVVVMLILVMLVMKVVMVVVMMVMVVQVVVDGSDVVDSGEWDDAGEGEEKRRARTRWALQATAGSSCQKASWAQYIIYIRWAQCAKNPSSSPLFSV